MTIRPYGWARPIRPHRPGTTRLRGMFHMSCPYTQADTQRRACRWAATQGCPYEGATAQGRPYDGAYGNTPLRFPTPPASRAGQGAAPTYAALRGALPR